VLRYLVHFISGVTIYAEWMPDSFLGMKMESVALYSFLYNGLYMIPTIICALIVTPILYAALERMLPAKKI
jgi:thiamine transporter